VFGEFVQSPQTALAGELAAMLPEQLQSIYLVSSGAEATEGALKLAKRYTGRYEIIAFKNAYHGSTQGALSVTGNEILKDAFRPLLPGVSFIDINDRSGLKRINSKTACVILEPIQGEAGVIESDVEWLQALRKKCTDNGVLLIFDEIQTGMGRTGRMFAFEHANIIPDVLLLGKAFGGGMPLAAFVASREIMSSLSHSPVLGHITTFGGHPLSCAAALAAMKWTKEAGILNDIDKKEQLFRKHLHHPVIKSIRGKGLLLGVQFESAEINFAVISKCLELGLITDWFLFNDSSMRIAPPLIIRDEQIVESCEIIINAIEGVVSR
jgi:acetylornithine/N-succinyldiaminopimelate aminotransferase